MRLAHTAILCFLFTAQAYAQEKFSGIRRLDLSVASGDVRVTGVDGDVTTLQVIKKRYDERCLLTVEQRGETLFVELASRNLFSAKCQADFQIEIPRLVSLKFKDGSGNITVNGTRGSMAVVTGSGHVNVTAKLSSFDARTGSGSVTVHGLESPASVHTGSGSVKLVYEKVPADGQLEIRSGSGDAEVMFPKHAKIHTSFRAGSGSLKNRLGESPDARFSISMKSGSGDLVVGKF